MDFAADMVTIGAYTLYLSVIFAAVRNRSTLKVETEHQKGFMASAIIALVGMGFINAVFFYNLILPIGLEGGVE